MLLLFLLLDRSQLVQGRDDPLVPLVLLNFHLTIGAQIEQLIEVLLVLGVLLLLLNIKLPAPHHLQLLLELVLHLLDVEPIINVAPHIPKRFPVELRVDLLLHEFHFGLLEELEEVIVGLQLLVHLYRTVKHQLDEVHEFRLSDTLLEGLVGVDFGFYLFQLLLGLL